MIRKSVILILVLFTSAFLALLIMMHVEKRNDTGDPKVAANSVVASRADQGIVEGEARRIILRPSEIGKKDTPIERGITALLTDDDSEARNEFQTACDSGSIYACVNLATMYSSKRSDVQDFSRARVLF